ncbi:MAG: DUF1156 domain-containing protein [Gammaproteobacteria bacterium]|nr:DUF1156 domain-containing protein [Gammaproteobacteria bacterium]
MREVTVGGVLHWGRESTTSNGEAQSEIELFQKEIRQAFGGRTPRVHDPFAGGGAIPLEAMRLGCEVMASDLNPVAWFILRCTLHYPNLLAGQELPLPEFALKDREFVTTLLKARGAKTKAAQRNGLSAFGFVDDAVGSAKGTLVNTAADTTANLAWHVRAWGGEVLRRARQALGDRYPTYAYFEPVRRKGRRKVVPERPFEQREPRLLEPDTDGAVSPHALNAEFDSLYLKDERNPRWIVKPTVAYLWARTVRCGRCRIEMPLLKTRWLCRRGGKRVLLTYVCDGSHVVFGIEDKVSGNVDGSGTMSKSGASCPNCGVMATMADLRAAGRAGLLGERMTAVVVDGQLGKEYRLPTEAEIAAARVSEDTLKATYNNIPFGLLNEPTADEGALGMRIPRYGFAAWRSLFIERQLLTLGVLVDEIRKTRDDLASYPSEWQEALVAYLATMVTRCADRGSAFTTWTTDREGIGHTFARFALPMVWDFAESSPLGESSGGFHNAVEWIARVVEHLLSATAQAGKPVISCRSSKQTLGDGLDLICTDPPYYDAIPYADLMDFFHVWLRRALHGLSPETDAVFANPLGPKWDADSGDGELIDDASRFGGDGGASKQNYEDGMAHAFSRFHNALHPQGRLVLVFASKSPDAWETLVSALIRAGFVVDGSWPIQTEMQNRQRSLSSAALSSSIWLVCKKRLRSARPGWDTRVLADMQAKITDQLREFWDSNIRGPDFVWAATGPALEAFSRHPVVKRTDAPGERMTVAGFLRHVRRMVVAFVVSRIFHAEGGVTEALDDPTTYYLLHRNDFGLGEAPAGACILYALSCGISDADLLGSFDILARSGRRTSDDAENIDGSAKGSEVALKRWDQRKANDLGEPTPDGRPPPLIDCVHRLMHVWKTGEQGKVDAYLTARSLWTNEMFAQVLQALIELADVGSDERSTLEYIQSHVTARGRAPAPPKLKI